jgi:nuclear transport factor 2 (NTF2) superfamily protein
MSSDDDLLRNLYRDFNDRDFERVIAKMHPDVKWANGMEGGFVYGRDAVREYWSQQFEVTQTQLTPMKFEAEGGGRHVVTVSLEVRDLNGNLLVEKTVQQIFTIDDGSISLFEIAGTEPLGLMGNRG